MKTITFYSYKGGVGRSLALANVALRLSNFNKKVCLIDFDLEAPGLPVKFSKYIKKSITKGLVDYIYDFSNHGKLPNSIKDYFTEFEVGKKQNISLLPAGNIDSPEYWKKLSAINWYDLLYNNSDSISFFLDLKQKIKKEINPDFILIDSRTGISEMSGITISLLADDVVIVSANNQENINGAKKIIKSLLNEENRILDNAPQITFVLSRVPFTENPDDRAREQILKEKVRDQLENKIEKIFLIHSDRELEENEQLKIDHEGGESVVQITKDYLLLFEEITKGALSNKDLELFNNIKESKQYFSEALKTADLHKRLELINKAIEKNQTSVEYYVIRANTNSILGEYSKAIDDYKQVMEIDNSYELLADFNIAQAYIRLNKYENAKRHFEKLVIGSDLEYQIMGLIGIGNLYLSEKNYDKALELYSEVITKDPTFATAYNNRANVFKNLNDIDNAFYDIFKALEYESTNPVFYLTLAEIYASLNKLNEFYLNLENALKLSPEKVEELLPDEDIYKSFANEKRFIKLLDKYNVSYNKN